MKKLIKFGLMAFVLQSTVHAESCLDVEEAQVDVLPIGCEYELPYYITVKGMITPGGDLREEEAYLESNHAYGVGMDIGYMFHKHFGVELALAYAKNDVTRIEEAEGSLESEEARASYLSYAINIIFKDRFNKEFGYFIKVGYEKEHEEIDDFAIDEEEHGIDAAVGLTYELNERAALLLEYEVSSIEGLRGDAFFLGVEYKF